jgi:hypothetical protein
MAPSTRETQRPIENSVGATHLFAEPRAPEEVARLVGLVQKRHCRRERLPRSGRPQPSLDATR